MFRIPGKAQLLALLLVGIVAFGSACSHKRVVQVGSHKVTIARHGVIDKVKHDVDAQSFEYEGKSVTGYSFKFSIVGDKIRVNDRDLGMLRKGDTVVVNDDGVLVNSMDHGDSEKYLRSNSTPAQAAVN